MNKDVHSSNLHHHVHHEQGNQILGKFFHVETLLTANKDEVSEEIDRIRSFWDINRCYILTSISLGLQTKIFELLFSRRIRQYPGFLFKSFPSLQIELLKITQFLYSGNPPNMITCLCKSYITSSVICTKRYLTALTTCQGQKCCNRISFPM